MTKADDFIRDLDGTCIYAAMNAIGGAALAEAAGYSDFDPDSDDGDVLCHNASVVIEALIEAGLLRREWFSYDDDSGSVVVVP